ncbi:hypothetical protein [Roseibium sp. M-1]
MLQKPVKRDRDSAIFLDKLTNPRLFQQIASETALKTGGTLHLGALSDENRPAVTCIERMQHGMDAIKHVVSGS